jgi:O-acetyl-ADP-ribose deacetylase (regulator of RNase III)
VNQGEVLVTTSGRLRDTHGVRAVLHAAVVTGAYGRGFQAISDDLLVETTRTVMRSVRGLIRSADPQLMGQSVILPLFGTGHGRMDPYKIIERLLDEVIQDLAYHAAICDPAAPDVRMVLFSAFTQDHVQLLQRLLDSLVEKRILRRAGTHPVRASRQ